MKKIRILQTDDPRHGANGYNNYGCKCDVCHLGWAICHIEYLNRHPEQRQKNIVRERLRTAKKRGFATREEYEAAPRPLRHANAKLTEERVKVIRSCNTTATLLAAQFGVSPKAVGKVRRGESWKYLLDTNYSKV